VNLPKPFKVASLADLKLVKKEIEAQALARSLAAEELKLRMQRTSAQHNLFQAAVGAVKPLRNSRRELLRPAPPPPLPRQMERDAAAALQESMSDEMDIGSLLDTDELLSFRRPGVGTDVTQKLRRGKWTIQQQIDLHGLRSDDAREALGAFIRDMHKQGIRCIRVVHGKGVGSPGKAPVLKDKVHRWLVQKEEVVAFVQAQPHQGGAGAVVVLLQPLRSKG
jgi:DNA-nicking Smr family endonuclease